MAYQTDAFPAGHQTRLNGWPDRTRPFPYVKWAGGKTQLLGDLLRLAPASFARYHEPFVGGGALFMALWTEGKIDRARLNDLNRDLMTSYEVIRTEPHQLCDVLSGLVSEFTAASSQEEFYYKLRGATPTTRGEQAARFIFLNKTGYNGLYRVNRKGQFNVPFGRYARPSIYDKDNIMAWAMALQYACLTSLPFRQATAHAQSSDFVYFDPPYQPISKTANFTGYTSGGFSLRDQELLADEFTRLSALGAFVMLSNSDHELIARLYDKPGFNITEVKASRRINSNPTRRGFVSELVVRNFY